MGGWGVVENSSLLFKRANAHSLKCDRTHLATVKFMWCFWSNFFRKQEHNSFPNLARGCFVFPFVFVLIWYLKEVSPRQKLISKKFGWKWWLFFFLHWGILALSNDQRKVSNIISACFLICVSFNQAFSNIKSKSQQKHLPSHQKQENFTDFYHINEH